MFAALRQSTRCCASRRFYSTETAKVPAKLIGELRKITQVSISKAKEALAASNNDVGGAVEWLKKDLAISGATKAAKVADRNASQGVVSTAILNQGYQSASTLTDPIRAAMIELNCETDFVSKNPLFQKLASDIATTAAKLATAQEPLSLDKLNAEVITQEAGPTSIEDAIHRLVATVGEKISLRRAVGVTAPSFTRKPDLVLGHRLAAYTHGAFEGFPNQGRIGALALLGIHASADQLILSEAFLTELAKLERALGRQVAGFETTSIESKDPKDESALYNQPFAMLPGNYEGSNVFEVLHSWSQKQGLAGSERGIGGVDVLSFQRWTVGEALPEA